MGLHSVQSLSRLHGCPRGERAQCTCRLGLFSGFCCPAKNSLLGIFWRTQLRQSLEHEPKGGTAGWQGAHTLILLDNTKLFPNLRPFTPSCSHQHGWEILSWSCQTCWFLPIWWTQDSVSLWFCLFGKQCFSPPIRSHHASSPPCILISTAL